jgi:hypothetical protein
LEPAVLSMVAGQLLSPAIMTAAVRRAQEKLSVPTSGVDERRAELTSLDQELGRLAESIAAGAPAAALVTAIQSRERRKIELVAEVAAATRQVNLSAETMAELIRLSKDWRALLQKRPAEGRSVLQRLIKGRLTVTPAVSGVSMVETGTMEPVLSAGFPQNLASPAGFEPAFWP